ncbi:pyrroline-5-carboxylate reductase [Aneurinibacillus sp. Ricciae_BoGa-3]|uniref:pyrroline-5-carboxylate reductase n=1 Tax=Aneurinibacillus sp. Ricciae_BoGa-3 TaxID=3022697 RepID=UPI002341FA44|nr:pyrroline-5-carboxylate reductase [Aneurinibacillus sp. Ricciae_BoGa-3]WCK55945.1 pyrroline-5-carboxylate reductase [Aneurinibacillus sp. Ricciae_BoGa-3]
MLKQHVIFIGAGAMAEAMIGGMIARKKVQPGQITAVNRKNEEQRIKLTGTYGIHTCSFSEVTIGDGDILILATKPGDAAGVLSSLAAKVSANNLIVSVIAGYSTQVLESALGGRMPIVRVMPNTSSLVGESATAVCFGDYVTDNDRENAVDLLEGIGKVYEIEEDRIDIFTAIAGSGPAYMYYLVEHLEKAGIEGGLDAGLARRIAAQTLLGAGKMLLKTGEKPEQLRRNVTTPNGITQAGVEALEKNGAGFAMQAAVKAAVERSRELNSQLK